MELKAISPISLNYKFPHITAPTSYPEILSSLSALKASLLSLQKSSSSQDQILQSKSEKLQKLKNSSKTAEKKIQSLKKIISSHQEKIIKFESLFNNLDSQFPTSKNFQPDWKISVSDRISPKVSLKLSSISSSTVSTPKSPRSSKGGLRPFNYRK